LEKKEKKKALEDDEEHINKYILEFDDD